MRSSCCYQKCRGVVAATHLLSAKLGELWLIAFALYSTLKVPRGHAMPHQDDLLVARQWQSVRR